MNSLLNHQKISRICAKAFLALFILSSVFFGFPTDQIIVALNEHNGTTIPTVTQKAYAATTTATMAELYMGARSNGSTAASAYVFDWVAPTGISSLDVEARAGGGGGGGSNGSTGGGGGGGGGGYAQSTSVAITAGNTYALTIGHGGNGGASTGAGGAGGDSSLSTLVVADGGTGGGAGTSGTAGAGGSVNTGDTTFNGGSGSAGAAGSRSGAGGGGAGDANNGTAGSGTTAGTGGSAGGGDGAAGRTTDGVGNNTTNLYGAGGGGGYRTSFTNRAGGSGTGGYLDLEYTYDVNDAFPIIRGISGGRSDAVDGTSHSITLPPDIEAGELLVVVFSVDASETVSVDTGVSGSNWTKLGQANNSGTVTMTSAVFWKVAEGSDVLTLTTTSEQSSHLVYRIANHNGEVTGTSVGGNSTNSNPPSHTPAGGSANYLWLSTRSSDSSVVATAAPSGYSFWRQADASGTNGAATDVAVRFANGTSEDPGTWTSATEQWVSWTLAIASQPDPGVYGTLYADEGTSPVTGGKTIKLAVGTTTPPNVYTTTTDTSTGAWSIAVPDITSTTTLVAWVDGDSSTKASTVALGSDSGVVTLELYQDHVIAGSSDTDGSLDLSDFAIYDSTSDADVPYTASTTTGTLELDEGMKLYIATGDTFALATTTILSGSFENNGTMTPGQSTTYFGASATIEGSGALEFNNVIASPTLDVPVWSAQTLSGDWRSVTYGNGTFVAVGYSGNRVMTSPDGITWTASSAAGDDDFWSSVTYGDGLFVAVSDCGTCGGDILMTSPDGITWTARSAAGDNDSWNSITYGNGLFVAVAESGGTLVMTSPDGITWTARSAAGDDDTWYSVTYGNGLFVAVGNSGDYVMTSPDGINWTARSAAGNNDDWRGVTYGNGLFVAVGDTFGSKDPVMTSPDGVNWTARSAAGDNDTWTSITYGDGLFVAFGLGSDRVMTSPDGITWTVGSVSGSNDSWRSVAYGDSTFVAAGSGTDRVATASWGEQTLTFSNNATVNDFTISASTTVSAPSTLTVTGDFTNNGTFDANDGTIIFGDESDQDVSGNLTGSSTLNNVEIDGGVGSGSAWTAYTAAGDNDAWTSITYGEGLFVAVGADPFDSGGLDRVITSPDGITWTVRTAAGDDDHWYGVTYGNGIFVAVGGDDPGTARVMTSPDGITWTAQSAAGDDDYWNAVIYADSLFVAVGSTGSDNNVMTSPDGITWTVRSAAGGDDDWNSIAYANSLFVAVGFSGDRVMTSPDGITWTARTAAEANQWVSVTYGSGLFVAISLDGTNQVMTSPDGITWTARSAANSSQWYAVTYGGGVFVAVSINSSNQVMFSTDGITWTTRSAATSWGWHALVYADAKFVAVNRSAGNKVMISADVPGEADVTFLDNASTTNFTIGTTSVFHAPDALTIVGNYTNNGTFDDNNGTVYLTGENPTLSGNMTGTSAFNDVMASSSVFVPAGSEWTSQSAAEANIWMDIAYGNGTFVAVANSGTNRVMTSPDGITWTARAAAEANAWQAVAYGEGLFVAVANNGTNRVMTSPDGITWTSRTAPSMSWTNVAYGNGTFVAVNCGPVAGACSSTSGDRAMTSPDGITWTSRPTAVDNQSWTSLTYGNGLFVTLEEGGGGGLMTSPDGITWTAQSDVAGNNDNWRSVAYGEGLFVAVSLLGGDDRVITSPDGITWTQQSAAGNNDNWTSVTYGDGVFVAVGQSTDRVMTSPDGITWTVRTAAASNSWMSVTYATTTNTFVAVSGDGTNRVMTAPGSYYAESTVTLSNDAATNDLTIAGALTNVTPSASLSIAGDYINNGIFTAGSGTTTFNGSSAQSLSGSMTGTSTFNNLAFDGNGTKTFQDNASTTNLTIESGATVVAPSALELTGNYTNNGTFDENGGEVTLSGSAQTLSGDMTGTSKFNDVSLALTEIVGTSPDVTSWTVQSAAGDNDQWLDITYGEGLFVAVGNSGDIVMTSPDGITWTARSAAGDNDQWLSVTYGNGTFVAVGIAAVMSSPDGVNWTQHSPIAAAAYWTGVTYGNGTFVAVSLSALGGNRVMYSSDGASWTSASPAGNDDNWNAVTYASSTFVAVGSSGDRVMTSSDGITWATTTAAGDNDSWNSVTYGNGIFVAVGGSGDRVMTSPDGITWTVQSAAGNDDNWQAVTYTGDLFVAVGSSGDRVMTSPDGITWTVQSAAGNNDTWGGVAFGSNTLVAVALLGDRVMMTAGTPALAAEATFGDNAEVNDLSINASSTLIAPVSFAIAGDYTNLGTVTWESGTTTFTGASAQVISGNMIGSSTFNNVVVQAQGDPADGAETWTLRTAAQLNSWQSITYGDGIFVAVSSDGTNRVMTSPDGITWTVRSAAEANAWRSVTHAEGIFVAVSSSGTNRVMTSPDGITWTARSAAAANAWESVTYGEGLFVAVACGISATSCNTTAGGSRVMTSPDGITWTGRTAAEANGWQSVIHGNGTFVAVSSNGTNQVMTSEDGTTWVSASATEANVWESVAYGGGTFVAVSSSGTNRIMRSVDGTTWEVSTAAVGNALISITYGGGLFVATGNSGAERVQTSQDGITWEAHTAAEVGSWISVTYGNGMYAAVNWNGTGRVMTAPAGGDLIVFSDPFETTGVFLASEPAYIEFPASATSTIASLDLTGSFGDSVVLRSTEEGTQWGFDVTDQISVEYVDVMDSNACSGNPDIVAASSLDSGNNDCWDITAPVGGNASISSAANQVFSVGQATTSISAITITDDVIASTITAANDIRIMIDTTKTDMLWDTTDTTAVFTGTASGKVSNPVSYEDSGATLVIPVSSDFSESDTLTVSGLSFSQFGTLAAPTSTLGISVAGAPQPGGETWTVRSAAGNNDSWRAVTYGNGLFVAVGYSGDFVMTSPDGITWTVRTAAENNIWTSVTYGNGTFVAVGCCSGNRVMTSPDGITWTARSAAGNNDSWSAVTYGGGLFVAVGSGTDRVMTSPDGTTWTVRTAAENNSWSGVTYGNGLFVAVSDNGTNRVMTSPDGITWTARSAAGNNDTWRNVGYGGGLFVAVGSSAGTTDVVMTSPDGITWTARSAAGNNENWHAITYGNGVYVAAANSGTDKVMTSPDGITWTVKSTDGSEEAWASAAYGNGIIVLVAEGGGTDRVMTAPGGTSGEPVAFDDKTVAISGSLSVQNHDAGQAENTFSYQNQTATPLFRFKMTPAHENATVGTLVFTLSGIRRIDSSNLSSLALYRDMDSDGEYDASDVAVGGAGTLSVNGQTGTITFATPFAATTSQNYILIGDVTDVKTNEYVTISLNVSGAVTGDTTGALIPPTGSVSSVQHIRGGGVSAGTAEIGGNAPEGDGDVGGGEQGGGSGEVGEGDGETIGNEPGFRAPAASDGGFTEWTNGGNALSSDGVYATAASTNLRQSYSVFGFSVPSGNTVQGIEVKLEAAGSTGAGTIEVALSWDGDQSVTATKATSVLTTSDAVYTLGGPSDTWGRSWTPSEFGDANFFVRVIGQPEGNTVRVDALQVRPYHQTGGGGGGGGGEI